VIRADEEDDSTYNEDWNTFWAALGGRGPVASASEGGDDLEAEKAVGVGDRLFRYGLGYLQIFCGYVSEIEDIFVVVLLTHLAC
jgi:hypothetical protein